MAGRPYDGGGIRTTVRRPAPPATTSSRQLARLVARRAPGHHDLRDQERLRPHRRRRGARAATSRAESHRRDHVPGRARRARRVRRPPTTTSTWSPARCWRPCAPNARWIDVFCEEGAFDADAGARACSSAGRARAGLRGRLHANQLGPAPGCSWPSSWARPPSTTARYLPTPTSTRWRRRATVATLLPGVRLLHPASPWPDARRLLDAGVTVALASDCNPGSLLHHSHAVLHRARGTRYGHDRRPRRCGPPPRAAPGRCAATTSAPSRVGRARRPAVLDAPVAVHLAYRPGVPAGQRGVAGGGAGQRIGARPRGARAAPAILRIPRCGC